MKRPRTPHGFLCLTLFLGLLLAGTPLLAALAPSGHRSQPPQRPDILILLTDQQRADELSIVGTPGASTPNLDALAVAGMRFTWAFCVTPQCSAARASLLTGRYPHEVGVMGNVTSPPIPAGMSAPLSRFTPNLAQFFARAGYATAYFGKWHLGGNPRDYGFQTAHPDLNDVETTDAAESFLQNRSHTSSVQHPPLLMVISWVNPHNIYRINRHPPLSPTALAQVRLPANRFDSLDTKPFPQRLYRTHDQGKPFRKAGDTDWRRYLAFYHQLAHRVDAQIGQVLKTARGHLDDPIIVFSADHGDFGGEHGLPFKGPAMYDALIHVPLLISWAHHIPAGTNATLVTHLDIFPTLAALAGFPVPDGTDGQSLAPLLLGQIATLPRRDAVFGEYYGKQNWRVPIRMIRTASWKYVVYKRYGEELYNLRADPGELRNLADSKPEKPIKSRLRARLYKWMSDSWDPFSDLTVTDRKGKPLGNEKQSGAPQ